MYGFRWWGFISSPSSSSSSDHGRGRIAALKTLEGGLAPPMGAGPTRVLQELEPQKGAGHQGKGALASIKKFGGARQAGEPYLSLLLSAFTSRPMASLLSVASSSSRCSFLRLALMRWDSSSASSNCLLSCLTFAFPFSACEGEV